MKVELKVSTLELLLIFSHSTEQLYRNSKPKQEAVLLSVMDVYNMQFYCFSFVFNFKYVCLMWGFVYSLLDHLTASVSCSVGVINDITVFPDFSN